MNLTWADVANYAYTTIVLVFLMLYIEKRTRK